MKTTMLYSLLFLTMLGLGIGCKKEVQELKPPVVISPPVSATTPPVSTTTETAVLIPASPQSSNVAYADLPPGCRIARTIYKIPTIGLKSDQFLETESITFDDGKRIQIGRVQTTTYNYDNRERITDMQTMFVTNSYIKYKYVYTPTTFYTITEYTAQGEITPNLLRDTTTLNKQGYVSDEYRISNPLRLYNEFGQVISKYGNIPTLMHTYENNNLVREVYLAYDVVENGQRVYKPDRVLTHRYDQNRPNLPQFYTFQGKLSRNLPLETITTVSDLTGPVYRKTHAYIFDERGRVKRRITYGRALNPSWGLQDDHYGIGVTDFEYENCP